MEALTLQVFVSLCLAAGGVLLFLFSGKWRDVEHADRLALFPIEEEKTRPHTSVEPALSEPEIPGTRRSDASADSSVPR